MHNNTVIKSSVFFIVKNVSSINRAIRLFNTTIQPGATLDLMQVPDVSEDDIRYSLIKGELNDRLTNKNIVIVLSTINMSSPDVAFTKFLNANNIYAGSQVNTVALTQANWYVDWTNGNDNNPGTISSPVKTVMGGIVAKWGTNSPVIAQSTNIYIVSSQPIGAELVVLTPIVQIGCNFQIIGNYQQIGSPFTIGTITAKNRSTGTVLSATGLPVGTSPGQILHNTTRGTRSFIQAMSGTSATAICQPLSYTEFPGANTGVSEVDTYTTGDTCVIETPTSLNIGVFQPITFGYISADPYAGSAAITAINFISSSNGFTNYTVGGIDNSNIQMLDCMATNGYLCVGNTQILNCYFVDILAGYNAVFLGGTTVFLESSNGNIVFDADHINSSRIYMYQAYANFGLVYITAASYVEVISSVVNLAPYYFATTAIWGPGNIKIEQGGKIVLNSVRTYTNCLLNQGSISVGLKSVAGYNYTTGVWTPNVPINVANIDGYGGLVDPVAGSGIVFG